MVSKKAEAARRNEKNGGCPRKNRAIQPTSEVSAPVATAPEKPTAEPAEKRTTTLENPFGLSPRELLFVEAYCGVANFNATKAYEMAGYRSSDANACRLIGKDRVSQAVAAKVASRAQLLQVMDGDEALGRITEFARADIRLLFPEDHPYRRLPDAVARSIKAVTPNRYGTRIELYDALKANELMAKASGKLKEQHV